MKRLAKNIVLFSLAFTLAACSSSPIDHSKTKYWADYPVLSRQPRGTQSPNREPIPFLEWEHFTSDKKSIVGQWEGTTFEGKKVTYHFEPDGKCEWSIQDKTIKGRYEIQEAEKYYNITMNHFNASYLKGVLFCGLYKIKGEEMLFYGVTVKDIKKLTRIPDSFDANSVLLKRR
ncbi:MAG: hypothetical protein KKF30_03585 [Proteobacteria bacterium]|nr:hypothetical protein [Pseudomonadota bacterium]MBU4470138.1 hypothetical protein [Pseudomonadota bacterium]MCG2753121.1 DUF5640 domain-containing protein [Desulfobacteraceae bacterium]